VNSTQHTRRILPAIAATALALTLGTVPAHARQDAGPALEPATTTSSTATSTICAPERVGTQYVACDNLTGNGVEAPAWVAER
jgi:hypothetical protein